MKIAIITIVIVFSALFFSFCGFDQQKGIKGSGQMLTEVRATESFESIDVSRAIQVYLSQGNQLSIKVEADANLVPYIKTEIKNRELKIYVADDIQIASYTNMKVFVTVPKITKLEAGTAAQIEGATAWTVNDLSLDANSAGKIQLDLTANSIELEVNSAAHINLTGSATRLEADVSSVGKLEASDLKVKTAKIDVNSAGKAEIEVTEQLLFDVNSGGHLTYRGGANIGNSVCTSGGRVVKKD